MKLRSYLLLIAVVASITAVGCGSDKPGEVVTQPQGAVTPPVQSQQTDLYTPAYIPSGDEIAVITTSKGVIRVQLAGKDAPIHVGNFVELAQSGFYNGIKFHRYEPGFVIQGGDPQTRDVSAEQVIAGGNFGSGGPGYNIKGEFTTNPNNRHLDGA